MAANQIGKTLAGGMETAMHATGRYPDWWKGKRFDGPTVGWACGVSGEVVRDTVQRVLVRRVGAIGTGTIPCDGRRLLTARLARYLAGRSLVSKGGRLANLTGRQKNFELVSDKRVSFAVILTRRPQPRNDARRAEFSDQPAGFSHLSRSR